MLKRKWIAASNWLNGWRQDYEGWWVRARRFDDELIMGPNPMRGFLEEASVAVMTPEDCYRLDRGIRP